jgi:hypothetical protein
MDSKLNKEESSSGQVYFGPRICSKHFPPNFVLPRDMPKYTRVVKPEDWLSDYAIAIDIAGGNKSLAVHYVPLMLQGSTMTWLNSPLALQINSWFDFKEAFVKKFTEHTSDLPARGSWPTAIKAQMSDVYARFYSCRQCWASKCRGL